MSAWRAMARAAGWPDERLEELRLAAHSRERVACVHPRALLIAGRQPVGAEYEQTFTREPGDAWGAARARLDGFHRVHTEDDGR